MHFGILSGIQKTLKTIQTADTSGTPNGNNIPTTNVGVWGSSTPQNESAILVYSKAANLYNVNDSPVATGLTTQSNINN